MKADNIRVPDILETIRKRPGMFIGNLKVAGFHQIIFDLIEDLLRIGPDHPVFEFAWYPENRFTISVEKVGSADLATRLEDYIVKYFNIGFNTIAALNSRLTVTARHGEASKIFSSIQLQYEISDGPLLPVGPDLLIDFTPDNSVFVELQTKFEWINLLLQQFAFLNPGLKIISIDHSGLESQRIIFYYPGGLADKLELAIPGKDLYYPVKRIIMNEQVDGFSYQVAICYTGWDATGYIKTYAGNIETWFCGSLADGIIEGLIKAVRKRAKKNGIPTRINRKLIREQFIILASVKGGVLNFEGSTKRKLDMPSIQKAARKMVSRAINIYLDLNPVAEDIFTGIDKA